MSLTMPRGGLPRIADYGSRNTGSLDASVLDRQLPKPPAIASAYGELAELSQRANSLQEENKRLKEELDDLIQGGSTPYLMLERELVEFEQKLTAREREISDIEQKYRSTKTPEPTFLEVEVGRERGPGFGLVATSLLVSNTQRSFFKGRDIYVQNQELTELIKAQDEELNVLRARLRMHAEAQRRELPRLTIDTLNRNTSPLKLVDATVPEDSELGLKRKLLLKELVALIETRKELVQTRRNRAHRQRITRERVAAATRIQSVFRGFLTRQQCAAEQKAAVDIQRVFRGYSLRRKNTGEE